MAIRNGPPDRRGARRDHRRRSSMRREPTRISQTRGSGCWLPAISLISVVRRSFSLLGGKNPPCLARKSSLLGISGRVRSKSLITGKIFQQFDPTDPGNLIVPQFSLLTGISGPATPPPPGGIGEWNVP